MRLWSLHPKYLDAPGLVALWREALLAQAVLRGETKGYRSHPQLRRFRDQMDPVIVITAYIQHVHSEAVVRGYRFDDSKILPRAGFDPDRGARWSAPIRMAPPSEKAEEPESQSIRGATRERYPCSAPVIQSSAWRGCSLGTRRLMTGNFAIARLGGFRCIKHLAVLDLCRPPPRNRSLRGRGLARWTHVKVISKYAWPEARDRASVS